MPKPAGNTGRCGGDPGMVPFVCDATGRADSRVLFDSCCPRVLRQDDKRDPFRICIRDVDGQQLESGLCSSRCARPDG